MNSRSQSSKSGAETVLQRYWRRNVRIMTTLIFIWALSGLGAGVLFADRLNAYTIPGTGFPLGFWFAHQGSIIAFVIIILVYCLLMNRLDAEHHREIEQSGDGGKG
jgi:putative solute:sodium symporter small subunit